MHLLVQLLPQGSGDIEVPGMQGARRRLQYAPLMPSLPSAESTVDVFVALKVKKRYTMQDFCAAITRETVLRLGSTASAADFSRQHLSNTMYGIGDMCG